MKAYEQHSTAILIFANSANVDCKRKGISNGSKLFNALTHQTLISVKKSKIPYFHFSEELQTGSTFGARFANAIQSVFDKGFERIITIGNDSPHLTSALLVNTQFHLENGKTVIGPSVDGGFYLMGLTKELFNLSDFEKLSWNTSNISSEVISFITKQSELVRLKTLFDVDSLEDLQLLVNRFKNISNRIIKIFLSILDIQGVFNIYYGVLLRNHLSSTQFNKGSPRILNC